MFVSDPLDSVVAISVVKKCRTLQSLSGTNLYQRKFLAEIVSRSQGPGGSLCQKQCSQPLIVILFAFISLFYSLTGADIMPDGISKLLKLIENNNLLWSFPLKLEGLVINFFYIAFRTWRCMNLSPDCFQPFEPFSRHPFGKNSDARTG